MLRRLYLVACYFFSWVLFALVGTLLNLACVPLLPWAGRRGLARRTRAVVSLLFRVWMRWFERSGVVRIRWVGFGEPGAIEPGCVYIANHPCLVDATLLLSRLPDTTCILKPALMRSPAIGACARVACLEPGDNLIDMVHRVSADVARGSSLLVFPEGTRTLPGREPGPFRNGYALVAERAHAPVRIVLIRSSAGLVQRGRAWWKAPALLPGWIEVRLGPRIAAGEHATASALARDAEGRLRAGLAAWEAESAAEAPLPLNS